MFWKSANPNKPKQQRRTKKLINETLILAIIVGFIAQLIDGALGMAYGVTSTSVILTLGIPPASASASVHTSEKFTTLVSALTSQTWKH